MKKCDQGMVFGNFDRFAGYGGVQRAVGRALDERNTSAGAGGRGVRAYVEREGAVSGGAEYGVTVGMTPDLPDDIFANLLREGPAKADQSCKESLLVSEQREMTSPFDDDPTLLRRIHLVEILPGQVSGREQVVLSLNHEERDGDIFCSPGQIFR